MGSTVWALQESPCRSSGAITQRIYTFLVILHNPLNKQSCVSVSQSMSAKLESRLETPVGNYIASSMASSPMDLCPQTRLAGMTPSQPSFLKLEVASTFPGPSSLTWNQL